MQGMHWARPVRYRLRRAPFIPALYYIPNPWPAVWRWTLSSNVGGITD